MQDSAAQEPEIAIIVGDSSSSSLHSSSQVHTYIFQILTFFFVS